MESLSQASLALLRSIGLVGLGMDPFCQNPLPAKASADLIRLFCQAIRQRTGCVVAVAAFPPSGFLLWCRFLGILSALARACGILSAFALSAITLR